MQLDLSKIKKVFFVGIGGIGVSAIARMMLLEGKEVLGSDISDGEVIKELRDLGAQIFIGQSFELIPEDTDLIIYSTAIEHYDKPLAQKIHDSKIISKSYPEMLHIVTADKYTIAVSGTHGKTTTTAMIAKILIDAGFDPSVIVGSFLKEYKSNLIVGKSKYFVVEACEYERHFLNINPKVLVITNIEADHLDYYKDLEDIEKAFGEMALQTSDAVICDAYDESVGRALNNQSIKVIDYTMYLKKVPELLLPGEHNRKDAAMAIAVCEYLGVLEDVAQKSIAQFSGTWRRFDKKGITKNGAVVYDDYAHHPTEIRATLEALREIYPKGKNKITIVFQPHLYSRTKALFADFVTAFNEADNVYFLPIFFAREEPDPSISSSLLAEKVKENVANSRAFTNFEEADEFFKNNPPVQGEIFVTMGAGLAYKVGDNLLK